MRRHNAGSGRVRPGLRLRHYASWLLVIERHRGIYHCWLCPSEHAFIARCRERFERSGLRLPDSSIHRWFDLLSLHVDECSIVAVEDAVAQWPFTGLLERDVRQLFESHQIVTRMDPLQKLAPDNRSVSEHD